MGIKALREMYSCCNLYIVGSRYEGGPQSVLEAPAMRVPIISTDVGIANQVLPESCVFDIDKKFYMPTKDDVEEAYNNSALFSLDKLNKRYINMLQGD